jgi:aminopeptidase N
MSRVVFLLVILFSAACHVSQNKNRNPEVFQIPEDSISVSIPEDAIVVAPIPYRATSTIVNQLEHTKVEMSFDWQKEHAFGKAWITLHPHFYPTDSLTLDAKGFDLHEVAMVQGGAKKPLKYRYDSLQIFLTLDKTYKKGEAYTVFISYTAKPSELAASTGNAITDDRGLYFVNADGKNPVVPRQLWTQGETESSSCWFPTIDKPNMKMTWELSMTVENEFITLSNGLLTSSKPNNDGTRTDTWKLDQPFAPYLVTMVAAPYAIVKDRWRNIEVNYYLEKPYEPYARNIFGNTPEMLEFYSNRLGVDYPWPKYAQVVVREFVTGAMENVTATTHGAFLLQTSREMIDGNNEDVIAHEAFHQWFGDLVTTESWSNIALNEAFATYGEFLWNEYKYGSDEAEYRLDLDLKSYLANPENATNELVRYHYHSRDDLFDAVSYAKGGRTLHMLRKYLGDEAFFASLKLYLDENKYRAAEVDELRLAFEKVTGKDLHWFFNQWFFSAGHPVLNVTYHYLPEEKQVALTVEQLQESTTGNYIYELPVAVDVYSNGQSQRHQVTINERSQTVYLSCASKPDLVNFDAEKMLICRKTVVQSDTAYAFQFRHAPKFLDRLEALQHFSKNPSGVFASAVLEEALNDRFWYLRYAAVANLKPEVISADPELKYKVQSMAAGDPKSHVRGAALKQFGLLDDAESMAMLENAIRDSSYLVIGEALDAVLQRDSAKAFVLAQAFENEPSEEIRPIISAVYAPLADASKNDFFLNGISKSGRLVQYGMLSDYGTYLARFPENEAVVSKAIPFLTEIAKTNHTWWLRMKATMSLQALEQSMIERKNQLAGNQAGDHLQRVESLSNELSALSQLISEIKAGETDDRLRDLYGRN